MLYNEALTLTCMGYPYSSLATLDIWCQPLCFEAGWSGIAPQSCLWHATLALLLCSIGLQGCSPFTVVAVTARLLVEVLLQQAHVHGEICMHSSSTHQTMGAQGDEV